MIVDKEKTEKMVRRDILIMKQQKQNLEMQAEQVAEQIKKLQAAIDEWSSILSD